MSAYVVSDVTANTETAQYAHALLPAQGWGEKDGTVTNSERRISRQRRFIEPKGEARADWRIMVDVAKVMGMLVLIIHLPLTYLQNMCSSLPLQMVAKEGSILPIGQSKIMRL